jgi:predicted nucleic acid-binding protein
VSKKTKKKSKASTYLSVGTTLFGAFGVARQLREARSEGDKLRLADAIVSAAAIVTGVALLARDIRRMNADEAEARAAEEDRP